MLCDYLYKSYLFSVMSITYSFIQNIISIFLSNGSPDYFKDGQLKIITDARLICSGISIFACMWILIFYIVMCIKFRCTKRRSSLSFSRQYSDIATDSENIQTSFVSKDGGNYDNIVQTRYKSVVKCSKGSRSSDINRNKMGIGNDLIFFLILSNLGWSVGTFLGLNGFNSEQDKRDPKCIAQAIVQNFFDISSLCFTMLISRVTLQGTKKCYADFRKANQRMLLFLLYSLLCPLILTLGPYLTDSLGCSGAWCWIDFFDMTTSSYIWIACIYAFDWLNIMYIIYALFVASRYFEKRKLEINTDHTKIKEFRFLTKYVLILKAFPIILIINRVPGLINRAYRVICNKNSFSLFIIHSVAISLTGLFNSLIYSYFYRRVFKCSGKKRESLETSESEGKNESNGINSH